MKTKSDRTALYLGLAMICFSVPAKAQTGQPQAEAPKSGLMRFAEQDYLLGTWGGLRSNLSSNGVDFEFVYFNAVPTDVSGGIKQGSVYEGALLMMLDLDSEKLAGYKGGQLHAGGLYLHSGRAFGEHFVGDLNKTSLLDFPDSLRLWELWYEQKFFGGKAALKLGQLAIDRDFILPEFYNSLASISFLNQTFFYPTLAFNVYDIAGLPPRHHALASTPYGAPGARLRIDPSEKWYLQAGVYAGNPDRSWSGTRFHLSAEEGALAYFEATYRLNQAKDDEGLEGNWKLGGYFHTGSFLDVGTATSVAFGLSPGPYVDHPNNYGLYFLADQYLYRETTKADPAKQGLVGFFRVAGAPKDRNLTQFGIDGGLVYKGLIPGRDWDTFGIAASYLEISRDISDVYVAAGLPKPDYEAVIEGSYKAQLTAWWTVQPSIQWVMHPGGKLDVTRPPIPNALVVIVQTSLRF